MNVALRKPMTVTDFLAWEEGQDAKYEFDGVDVRAMVGVSEPHAQIQANLIAALHARLRGGVCRVLGSDLKIRVADRIRYPDAFVTCSPAGRDNIHDKPVVVFEIVSPSSDRIDRFVKNAEYRQTASIQGYVILQQDYVGATMFERMGDDWVGHAFGPGTTLSLPGIEVEIPLDDLYEGVELAA